MRCKQSLIVVDHGGCEAQSLNFKRLISTILRRLKELK